jgi:hypothetical protein
METVKLLSFNVYGFFRYKFLECRISTIEERIDKLHELSLFYQRRFDKDRADKINDKIEYLTRKKLNLVAVFQ